MSKEFSFANKGTCSKQTNFVLNDDHTIASMEVIGGCNGNLKGICRLVKGMKAEDVIDRMEGHAVRVPQHQLPGPDRTEPEEGSGRNGLKKSNSEGGDACGYLFLFSHPDRKRCFFSVLRGYTSCENEFHQQGARR